MTKQLSDKHDTITGYDFTVDDALPVRKSIRLKCLECVCGSSKRVEECHITDCTLWPYRLGRGVQDGKGKRTLRSVSAEQRAASSERAKRLNAQKPRA